MGKINICLKIKGVLYTFWEFIKNKEFIRAFTATLLGVLIAFCLNDLWHKIQSGKRLEAELCAVYSETKHNARVALDAEKLFGNDPSTPLKRPTTTALENALFDPNLLFRLPYDTIYLLRSYEKRLNVFEEVLNSIHIFRIQNIESKKLPTTLVKPLKHNIADTKVHCALVQEKLRKYYDKYSKKHSGNMAQLKSKLKNYKNKALEDNLEFFVEENP